MSITPSQALACPLDGLPLHCTGSVRSRDPGDSKEMVAARRRFLTAGFYQPIAAAVSRAVLADLPADASISCLDAGCGEGYYLRQLATAVPDEQTLALLGLDISKWAVLSAAKRDKRATWVVGSNANLPVLSGTLDRVLCMFGFPVYPEFARVLKPGGRLVQVDAGPDHLRELRAIIYPSLKPERTAELQTPDGFSRLSTETLRFSIELTSPEQIADLLAMTPHLYRASAEGRDKAAALTALSLSVEVRLTCFKRDLCE